MRLKEDLVNKYRIAIINEKYKIGDALPSQRELAEIESISKSVANAIYRDLEDEGLLETVNRTKTIVADWKNNPKESTLSTIIKVTEEEPNDKIIRDFTEFRISIELKIAAVAAQNRTENDMETLYKELDNIKNSKTKEEFAKAHLDFHQAMFKATHNVLFSSFAKLFASVFYKWGIMNYSQDILSLCSLLENVCKCIENKDSIRAEAAMNMYSYESSLQFLDKG